MQTNCCADAETIIRNTSVAMRLILLRLLIFVTFVQIEKLFCKKLRKLKDNSLES